MNRPCFNTWKDKVDGFRAWFVLQHYNYFGGMYKPFASIMVIDVPFEGKIQTWTSGK